MTAPAANRDHYIDFMRGFGLLLLVVAHTWAPSWMARLRVFDVPMMVFISAMCYRPMKGGYLRYGFKRFKRICYPVYIFLTLFFAVAAGFYLFRGQMAFGITFPKILGSYLLLNEPSIGYVWIMRVFLLMALALPFLERILRNVKPMGVILIAALVILIQPLVIGCVSMIGSSSLRIVADQIIPYLTGYSAIAIVGLKIREFSMRELCVSILVAFTVVVLISVFDDQGFNPQKFKYPPQALYIVYGILGSMVVWSLRGLLAPYVTSSAWRYLSVNSMWLYLWHIVPIYIITPWAEVKHMWFGRFCIVLVSALILNFLYDKAVAELKRLRRVD